MSNQSSVGKHTAGPWDAYDREQPLVVKHPGLIGIARCLSGAAQANQPSPSEALANAHLIAAAPELLNALKMTPCPKCENGDGIDGHEGAGCYKQIAIAKAEGRV